MLTKKMMTYRRKIANHNNNIRYCYNEQNIWPLCCFTIEINLFAYIVINANFYIAIARLGSTFYDKITYGLTEHRLHE